MMAALCNDLDVEQVVEEKEKTDQEAVAEVSTKRKRSSKTSTYPGVKWLARKKLWEARMTVDKKIISLGVFEDEYDAGKCYREMYRLLQPDASLVGWEEFEEADRDAQMDAYFQSLVDNGTPAGFVSASNRPVWDEVSSNSETLGSKDTVDNEDPFDIDEEEGSEIKKAEDDIELEKQWKQYYDNLKSNE